MHTDAKLENTNKALLVTVGSNSYNRRLKNQR